MGEVVQTLNAVPRWSRWTGACAAGETVGMAAAALAAGVGIGIVGEPSDLASAALVLGAATLGGLVEGLAVGLFQHHVLQPWLPGLSRRRWVGVTAAVAVGGWFLGMLGPTLGSMASSASDAAAASPDVGPPLWVMPFLGLASGLVAGAIFGAAQGWTLRRLVAHPRVWVGANALGWAAALAVIFTGAALPGGDWPLVSLLTLGAVTGVLAGLAIGAITGVCLPALDDTAPRGNRRVNRLVLFVLRSPAHRLMSGALVDLRYTGTKTRRHYALPVQYARVDEHLFVLPAHPGGKVWWRSLAEPADVEVCVTGQVRAGIGRLLLPADPGYADARKTYLRRWPRTDVPTEAVLVEVLLT